MLPCDSECVGVACAAGAWPSNRAAERRHKTMFDEPGHDAAAGTVTAARCKVMEVKPGQVIACEHAEPGEVDEDAAITVA